MSNLEPTLVVETKPDSALEKQMSNSKPTPVVKSELRTYRIYSYCCHRLQEHMSKDFLRNMLKREPDPDVVVLSHCPGELDEHPDYQDLFTDYNVWRDGHFYFIVRNSITIAHKGTQTSITTTQPARPRDCHRQIKYAYVDLNLRLYPGQEETQMHRIVAVFHAQNFQSVHCSSVIFEMLKLDVAAENQPITHICGALNIKQESAATVFENCSPQYSYMFPTNFPKKGYFSQNFNKKEPKEYTPLSGRGTLYTNNEAALHRTNKPHHPSHFLPGFRVGVNVGAVVEFTITPVPTTVKTEPLTGKPSTSAGRDMKIENAVNELGEKLTSAVKLESAESK